MARIEQVDSPSTLTGRMTADSLVWRSLAVAIRWIARGSRAVLAQGRRLDAAMGRLPLPRPDPADEERAKGVLEASRLVAWIDKTLDVPGRAWASSTVRRWLQPSIDNVRALPPSGQLGLLGRVLVIATITHVILVLTIAEPVGWATWAAWLSFLAAAGALAVWPGEVVVAWRTSAFRRRLPRRKD